MNTWIHHKKDDFPMLKKDDYDRLIRNHELLKTIIHLKD